MAVTEEEEGGVDTVAGPSGSSCVMKTCLNHIVGNVFMAANIAAVFVGICLGMVLKFYCNLSEHDQNYIDFPGEILMHMLQCMTVPLIVTSVVTGVSGLSNEGSRKIPLRTAAYIVSTTLVAVTTGLIMVLILKPGAAYSKKGTEEHDQESFSTVQALCDLVRNIFPQNVLRACFSQYKSEVESDGDEQKSSRATNDTEKQKGEPYTEGTNTVGLIAWSLFVGLSLNRMGEEGKSLVKVLTVLNEASKSIFNGILYYLPVGVMFLITKHVVEVHDWENTSQLAKFIAVVLLGLVVHGVILLPLIFFLFTRQSPMAMIKGISPALLTALLTSSSSATLPHTFKCCEERLGIDKRVTRMMLPIGTNINMNGTALYEAVAAVFIAQLNHIHLNLGQLITLLVTSAVSSVGAAGVPATGAATTMFVLLAVGLPAQQASILVVIEWILDRCNTVLNVFGDCVGVALVYEVSREELEEMDVQDQAMPGADGSEAVELEEIHAHVSTSD
ncbi:excitatory amino acid transporter 3-like isoform X1 [Notolabrus celidotus]|uniref:excitatory amino acid transporter 3-like isoform X1 n=1 Tax=Notolabrus celidotus TaxID=1203425 RepID=UPI0014905FD0|nr:excitatory amino acid transporter 3-like isoform X1 [Notolabrus celidotus]